MHNQAPSWLPDITAWRLFEVLIHAANTAGGMDNWLPAKMKLLTLHACQILADILNMAEHFGKWPNGQNKGILAFLSKDPDKPHGPLAYRLLTLLPCLYRHWATMRLEDMHLWIQTWAENQLLPAPLPKVLKKRGMI